MPSPPELNNRRNFAVVRGVTASLSELERAYREHYPRFAHVAAAIARDPELGREAVQSAFVTAVRERRSLRGEGPWVWRIVVNEARRLAREPRHGLVARLPPSEPHGPMSGVGVGVSSSCCVCRVTADILVADCAALNRVLVGPLLNCGVRPWARMVAPRCGQLPS